MSAEAYKGVRLVLGDPDPTFGKIVSSAVFPLGLRDIAVCLDGNGVRQAAAATVDVIVCDTNLPGLDFRAFVQDIRHGRVGANPFVILIATVSDAEVAKASGIAGSGIDELIVKPINPLLLVRRIGAMARERKPFVMTPGYVGPSRRAERRNDGSDDNLVAVPNTLRARMIEKKGEQAIGGLVAAGRASLDEGVATSGIKTVARLTRHLAVLQEEDTSVEESLHVLNTLSKMADEVATQHRNGNGNGAKHVAPIAERIARLAGRAEASAKRPPRIEIDLLTKLSDAVTVALAADARASGAAPEIVAVVDGYLARP
jgi:DNA-binding response OmpR family regulator